MNRTIDAIFKQAGKLFSHTPPPATAMSTLKETPVDGFWGQVADAESMMLCRLDTLLADDYGFYRHAFNNSPNGPQVSWSSLGLSGTLMVTATHPPGENEPLVTLSRTTTENYDVSLTQTQTTSIAINDLNSFNNYLSHHNVNRSWFDRRGPLHRALDDEAVAAMLATSKPTRNITVTPNLFPHAVI
jgi:hypothetical protein